MSPWWTILLLALPALADDLRPWQPGPGHRRVALLDPGTNSAPGFTRLGSERTGIAFTNRLSRARYTTNQIHLNGSGVAAGDIDGDGRCDLYFCGLDGGNALYRNLGGWRFEDVTAPAGVAASEIDATGAALADLDGDGDLDLIVNSIGAGTHFFWNDGRGRFLPRPDAPPVNVGKGGMSLALADVDGDSDLDLYVANYRTVTIRDQPDLRIRGTHVNGRPVVSSVDDRPITDPSVTGRFTLEPSGRIIENGEIDGFFLNDGQGRFTARSFLDGTFLDEDGAPLASPPYDWGLSALFHDFNRDGAPDLYVGNDFRSPDRFWINDGRGRFRAAPRTALRHTSLFSMGFDVADVDRDGHDDLFVADMLARDPVRRRIQAGDLAPPSPESGRVEGRPQYSHNTLSRARGDGTFAEIGWYAGVTASEWSWCPVFLDVDLDGYEDLLITNGHERDAMNADVMEQAERTKARQRLSPSELRDLANRFARLDTPNAAFRNRGDLTFEDKSRAWGFDAAGVSHGMCLADLDGDGDLDVAMNNLNGLAGLHRNEAASPRVQVVLRGRAANTHGIGARVTLTGGAVPSQSREVHAGGRYLSGDQTAPAFACGTGDRRLRLEVVWRGGSRSVLDDVLPNHLYEIKEPDPTPDRTAEVAGVPVPAALFEDASHRLGHAHVDEPYDELARQPLLPRRLGQLGPGVAWIDLDDDGLEDLVVGSGRGGPARAYRNPGDGSLVELREGLWNRPLGRDLTGLVGWPGLVLAGSANYEDGLTNGGAIRIYDVQRKASGENLRGESSSTGPLALADVDGDGQLDLFVGGRVMPGAYPVPATSLLLRNQGGRLVPWQRFEQLGLVSGALFSDLDLDGTPELVLACEWGPIRILQFRDGAYRDRSAEWGTAGLTGWWNGIAAGDLDGDGRLDLVASNWGLNSRYHADPEHPCRIHFGDLDGSGVIQPIESLWAPAAGRYLLDRGFKSIQTALPWVASRIGSFEHFARARPEELFGDPWNSVRTLEAATLATVVLLHRGSRFESRPLPREAQWSPAFAVNIADADGDGNEDVFLGQNHFGTHSEIGRGDAGRGLWLLGDGRGTFRALDAAESGVAVYGEQRGAALSDFDRDGRVDLVVTQNGAETRLFRNTRARPGLRVRLRGFPGNPMGVGAILRLRCGGRWGPARELHAGSGYWSQDAAVAVLASPAEPEELSVRWPGGRMQHLPIPPGTREIVVSPDAGNGPNP